MGNENVSPRWSNEDLGKYGENINAPELLAVLHSPQSFGSKLQSQTTLIRSDNMTTVSYLNEFGCIMSILYNGLAREVWSVCTDNSIFCMAAHIKGELNVDADKVSRVFNDDIEYMLDRAVFHKYMCNIWRVNC